MYMCVLPNNIVLFSVCACVCVCVCVCVCLCVTCFLQTKKEGAISVIPSNTEKYIAFFWRQFAFIDSLAFLDASLDNLAKTTSAEAFHQVTNSYPDSAKRELMMRKGVYPYEYVSDFAKFDETALPPQPSFYSSLTRQVSTKHPRMTCVLSVCPTVCHVHDVYLSYCMMSISHVHSVVCMFYRCSQTHYACLYNLCYNMIFVCMCVQ